MQNCVIAENVGTNSGPGNGCGAGINAYAGSLEMTDCEVRDNQGENAARGGGMYVIVPTTMTNCTISGNTLTSSTNTDYGGGGIYLKECTVSMTDCRILNNTSVRKGGGVYIASTATLDFTGGEISGNSSNNDSNGVYKGGTFNNNGGTVQSD